MSYIFLPPYAAPAISNKLIPPSKGTGQGGNAPPQGNGGPPPIPIPAPFEVETKNVEVIKNRTKTDLIIFLVINPKISKAKIELFTNEQLFFYKLFSYCSFGRFYIDNVHSAKAFR